MKNLFWAVAWLLAGCTIEWQPTHQYQTEGEIEESEQRPSAEIKPNNSELGGVNENHVVHLPFADGESRLCVQGAHESFSHNAWATKFDLDFDTRNDMDEEIYVPAPGVAYVHENNPGANFGRHVNIDLDDGTYIVIAHFKEIFLRDGAVVAPGQLMGFEGCTGYCTGDHVHFGRHRGDATQEAQFGESISVNIHNGNADISTEDFVCGLVDGYYYSSSLPVICAHPDGTLVKDAHSAKTYLLDQGHKRWITTQEVFWSRGYDFADVVVVADEELRTYPIGSDITEVGRVIAAYDEDQQLWLFVGHELSPNRYRQRVDILDWQVLLRSWGLHPGEPGEPWPYQEGSDSFFTHWPAYQGWATFRDGALLKEVSRSDVYVVVNRAIVPIETWNTFLMLGYRHDRILIVSDGSVAHHFDFVGSCSEMNKSCLREDKPDQCGVMDLGLPGVEMRPEIESESISDVGNRNEPDAGVSDVNRWDAARPDTARPDSIQPDAGNRNEPDAARPDTATPDTTQPDISSAPDQTLASETPRTLHVRWVMPFAAPAARITLSGEYTFANGSLGFYWHELKSVYGTSVITYDLSGVWTGDRFRFSVEFEEQNGFVSWSCIGPYITGTGQQSTLQGSATAHVDNQSVAVQTVGDPTGQTTGCGLIVHIP